MNQNDLSLYEKVTEQCRDFRIPPPIEPLLPPDDFLADGDVVQWAPDLTMRCLHCPGHTPGQGLSNICLLGRENLIIIKS